jgi:hypothetical protein
MLEIIDEGGVSLRDMVFGNVTPCILVETMSLVFPRSLLSVEACR